MDPEFKLRDGARGQNLGHFCKICSYAANKLFKCLYSQSSKKHSYLEHVYVHAIFIQVHGHLCFINKLKGFFRVFYQFEFDKLHFKQYDSSPD